MAICVSRAFNKRLGTVRFLRACRLSWTQVSGKTVLKAPIERSEELAGGSWRGGPLGAQYGWMQCRTILADASRECIKGWRCAAVQCDAMRCDACLVGLRARQYNNTPGSNSSRGWASQTGRQIE